MGGGMDLDAEFQYMRDSGLPAMMEGLLSRLVEERPSDPLAAVAGYALRVRAASIAGQMVGMWPKEEAATDAERRALATFDFDVFAYAGDDPHADRLLVFADAIFDAAGALDALGCPRERFRLWLTVVREQYDADIPFHTFRHAFAVLQQAFVFLRTAAGLAERLRPLEVAALLFSCLCHDMGHPGQNNAHQVNAETPLAVRYNDQSVLENWHCSLAFETVRCPECDILSALPPERRRQFRQTAVALIMATDVSKHKAHYTALSDTLAAREKEGQGQWSGIQLIDWDDEKQRLMVLQNLMMMADISNETRAFSLSKQWAPLVVEEFCRQGDIEKREKLPFTKMCDREHSTPAGEQPGFIQYLCLPLYEANVRIFPELQCCVDRLRANKESWAAEAASAGA